MSKALELADEGSGLNPYYRNCFGGETEELRELRLTLVSERDALAAELRRLAAVEARQAELLEALQGMVAAWGSGFDEGDSPSLDKARAAISKATGETK